MPVRLFPGTYREPDLVYMRPDRIRDPRRPPEGADLAMEIVSEGEENRKRDLETKRSEYARAGIPEYWIVDPQEHCITVLRVAVNQRKREPISSLPIGPASVLPLHISQKAVRCFFISLISSPGERARSLSSFKVNSASRNESDWL